MLKTTTTAQDDPMTVPLQLFDSRARKKVPFTPCTPGKVSMYLCGPTVYAPAHVGHGRSAVAIDAIRRSLEWRGFDVRFVRNVTDIDDNIIRRSAELGESADALAKRFTVEYNRDMLSLGIKPPDVEPKVTEHIVEIVDFIKKLVDSGHAYESEGDVYFSVDKFDDYGDLSGQSIDDLRAGARVDPNEKKRAPLDFALWKATKPGEPKWESPWGLGRPGWHIECSAMVLAHLGETFDIHAGGKDLIFPHHENENAQSRGALGSNSFARYWLHNGFLNFNDEKMSKSLGNVFLIDDMCKICDGEAIRFFMLQQHYRSPINFEVFEENGKPRFPGIEETERRLDYFYTTLARLDDFLGDKTAVEEGEVVPEAQKLVTAARAAVDDDFNTAIVVAVIGDAIKAANKLLDEPKSAPKPVRRRSLTTLSRDIREVAQQALGLLTREPRTFLHARRARLAAARDIDPKVIDDLIEARALARKSKEFERADQIRQELAEQSVELMDTPTGTDWRIRE